LLEIQEWDASEQGIEIYKGDASDKSTEIHITFA
jgi:hypothetical protein